MGLDDDLHEPLRQNGHHEDSALVLEGVVAREDDDNENDIDDEEEGRDALGPLSSRLLAPEDTENVQEATAFTRGYIQRLQKLRRWVIGFWALMFLIGAVFAPQFLDVVLLVFEPPPGTAGAKAQQKLKTEFPDMSHEADTIVLMRTHDGTPILDAHGLRPFIEELSQNAIKWGHEIADPETEFEAIHYYFLKSVAAESLSHALLDNSSHPEHATAMIATLHLKSGFAQGSMEGQRFCNWLDEEIARVHNKFLKGTKVVASATGMLPFVRDMQQGTEEDMIHMDSLSFPLALAVLAYMLRSVRLLIIPIISMVLSIVVSFTVMYPIALSTTVIAIAPSTMMSVAVAFSIDYSLFLLSAFRREVVRGATVYEAVLVMSDTAGHTIMVSGATIAICWFGLLFFPVTLLSTIGLGAGLTVVVAFLVNISLTPALLLSYGDFFTDFSSFGCKGCCKWVYALRRRCFCGNKGDASREEDEEQANLADDAIAAADGGAIDSGNMFLTSHPMGSAEGMRSPLSHFATPASPDRFGTPTVRPDGSVGQISSPVFGLVNPVAEIAFLRKSSPWFSCGERIYGTPLRALTAVVLVSAAILPLTPTSLSFHHSEDFKLFTPLSSTAVQTAIEMEGLFGGGRLAPYELVIEPSDDTSVLSNKFFEHMQEVIYGVVMDLDYGTDKPLALRPDGVSGPMMLSGYNITLLPTYNKHGHHEQLSVAGCLLKDLEYVPALFSICANSRCQDALSECRSDPGCEHDVQCFDNCLAKAPFLPDEAACLASCAIKLHRHSNATQDLGSCILNKCIEHPAGGKKATLATAFVQEARELALQSAESGSVSDLGPAPDCPSVSLQFVQSVHGRKLIPKSMCIVFNLEIDPYSQDGVEWLDAVREALTEQSSRDGYKYYLTGGDVPGHDTVNKVFELFPRVLGILAAAILVILGVSYRSVAVPAVAIFTIALTLILVYALGVLVYEHGALEFLGIRALRNPIGDALVWIVPALSAVVSSGLSTDYTVFGVDAVHTYREAGFSTRDSILCGNGQTGAIITAAGIIMTFAFAGLSLSSNSALNQLSFFLVVSVLADTFIIRTILMPAIMIVLGEKNWWPMKPATLNYEAFAARTSPEVAP
ncbi:MmpL efflux pump, putative [Hondaea fermentalgiana]|uniref:MmpL efflux pump, putative n=1 Tax=Hondaea fermentalgiana TaxID=2315210 RepID=A0A2R5GUK3_9STRA|nr:MmpL efflux pump, putative [Hondaea fermentalgiana]|eukprot:GBG34245.1 MmpL efflux pump, putative [Hondaea fermentalgiana]